MKHVIQRHEHLNPLNPLSGRSKCLENQLSMLFQNSAGWKLMLIYDSEISCPHFGYSTMLTVSKYSSHHLLTAPRRNGSFGHSAEPQKPRCFFMAPTVLLRERNTGDVPGIVQARKTDVPETTNRTTWKNVWSIICDKVWWKQWVYKSLSMTGWPFPLMLKKQKNNVLTIAH